MSAQKRTVVNGEVIQYAEQTSMIQYYATPFQNNLNQVEMTLDAKGRFETSITILENQVVNLFLGSDIVKIHVHPGDSIFVRIKHVNGKRSQEFYGTSADDAAWPEKQRNFFIQSFESPTFSNTLLTAMGTKSPELFKLYLDSVIDTKTAYLNKNSQNLSPKFIHWQKAEIKYEMECFRLNYPSWFYSMRGLPDQEVKVEPSYFDYLNEFAIHDSFSIGSNQYRLWLKYYYMYELKKLKKPYTATDMFQLAKVYFRGEILKNFQLHLWADIILYGQLTDAQEMYPMVKAKMGNEDAFKILEKIYEEKLPFKTGADAIRFTLKSIDGQPVSLSDFKGKVVYIDFWASWCGPCLREVPAGEDLKKAFAGKEVVFLNISIDEDENKWRESVKSKGISGIHLLANSQNNPAVLEAYRIVSIPSYFLVGKDGKILAAPAVRPSNPQIYDLIQAGLKQE
ncbi:MAG: TlpA disulfide reductase family protein [bacterium]|nr:TlpA disulfide reductase family protein [bacterium]